MSGDQLDTEISGDYLLENRSDDPRLVFSEVRNEVLFVNKEVYSPLQLKKGRSSPLGIFVEAAYEQGITRDERYVFDYSPDHHRSIQLSKVYFADKEGRIYRDIDVKGIGNIIEERERTDSGQFSTRVSVGHLEKRSSQLTPGVQGLLERDVAFTDYDWSEQFLKTGIRAHRVLAIIGLKELIVNGRKITISQAIEDSIIDEDFNPVVSVRAFGTKARIINLSNDSAITLFEDAKKMLAKELRKEKISNQKYVMWFARNLGRNIGLMHKQGWVHNYLTQHNITLDCRIVDLDSVTEQKERSETEKDFEQGYISLYSLLQDLERAGIGDIDYSWPFKGEMSQGYYDAL